MKKWLLLILLLAFADHAFAAQAGVVPVCVAAGPPNVVPVYEAPAGAGVVPVAVFADAASAGGTCVPVRVVAKGTEQAVPVVVVSGSLGGGDNVLLETGDDLLLETGDLMLLEG